MMKSLMIQLLFGSTIATGIWSNMGLLLLRFHVGFAMAMGGLDKLPVPDWFVGQVADLGFPAPSFFAFAAAMAEFVGGILLAIGLCSRLSAAFLAFTIGVAAFGFHQVTPLLVLHITQSLFWSYVLFTFAGGGRFAIDHLILGKRDDQSPASVPLGRAGFAVGLVLLVAGFGLYRQSMSLPQRATAVGETLELRSVSLAGTFNDWDLEATPMALQKSGEWQVDVELPAPGPIEFKFAANGTWDVNCGELDQAEDADQLPLQGIAVVNSNDDPANIRAFLPTAGIYRFSIDPGDFVYRVDPLPGSIPVAEDLMGEWKVDLRPSPDAPPYYQPIIIESVTDGRISGSFYNTPISSGLINTQRGDVRFSFTTEDGTGPYYSSGRVVDGQLQGSTFSPGREMLSVWTAVRVE